MTQWESPNALRKKVIVKSDGDWVEAYNLLYPENKIQKKNTLLLQSSINPDLGSGDVAEESIMNNMVNVEHHNHRFIHK